MDSWALAVSVLALACSIGALAACLTSSPARLQSASVRLEGALADLLLRYDEARRDHQECLALTARLDGAWSRFLEDAGESNEALETKRKQIAAAASRLKRFQNAIDDDEVAQPNSSAAPLDELSMLRTRLYGGGAH